MSRPQRGFTLIELLVVIAIIAILAAILFPVFAKAREKANQATCMSNQRQIAISVQSYAYDHDQMLPEASADNEAYIWKAVSLDKGVLVCPTKGILANGYGYNVNIAGQALGDIPNSPDATILTADAEKEANNVLTIGTDVSMRHLNGVICSYLDGHVQLLKIAPFLLIPNLDLLGNLPVGTLANDPTGNSTGGWTRDPAADQNWNYTTNSSTTNPGWGVGVLNTDGNPSPCFEAAMVGDNSSRWPNTYGAFCNLPQVSETAMTTRGWALTGDMWVQVKSKYAWFSVRDSSNRTLFAISRTASDQGDHKLWFQNGTVSHEPNSYKTLTPLMAAPKDQTWVHFDIEVSQGKARLQYNNLYREVQVNGDWKRPTSLRVEVTSLGNGAWMKLDNFRYIIK